MIAVLISIKSNWYIEQNLFFFFNLFLFNISINQGSISIIAITFLFLMSIGRNVSHLIYNINIKMETSISRSYILVLASLSF